MHNIIIFQKRYQYCKKNWYNTLAVNSYAERQVWFIEVGQKRFLELYIPERFHYYGTPT